MHRLRLVFSLPYHIKKVLPGVLSTRQHFLDGHSVNFRCVLVGLDPLVSSVQVLPAQNSFKQSCIVLLAHSLTASILRSHIPFVFCTISLRAAQVSMIFCVLHAHDEHPCLWLNPPATERLRDFHPRECALTRHTNKDSVTTFCL